MAELIPGLASIDWFSQLSQVMYYAGMVFIAILILAVFTAILYVMKFRIKATVIPMFGSGKDGIFTFGKTKWNRAKWVNDKTAWKSLLPLFNKKEREPFDSEFIYPGNRIYIYELNDEWVPGRINVNKTEDEIRAEINPVPYYVRNWQSLQYRKHELEFAKQDFWTENKQLLVTLSVVAFCCILCGAVIYFTFQFAGGAKESMDFLSTAIQGVGNIPSSGVIPK